LVDQEPRTTGFRSVEKVECAFQKVIEFDKALTILCLVSCLIITAVEMIDERANAGQHPLALGIVELSQKVVDLLKQLWILRSRVAIRRTVQRQLRGLEYLRLSEVREAHFSLAIRKELRLSGFGK